MGNQAIVVVYTILILFSILCIVGNSFLYRLVEGAEKNGGEYKFTVNRVELNFIRVMAVILSVLIGVGFLKNLLRFLKTGKISPIGSFYLVGDLLALIALIIINLMAYDNTTVSNDVYAYKMSEATYNYTKFGIILLFIILGFELLQMFYEGYKLFYLQDEDDLSTLSSLSSSDTDLP